MNNKRKLEDVYKWKTVPVRIPFQSDDVILFCVCVNGDFSFNHVQLGSREAVVASMTNNMHALRVLVHDHTISMAYFLD